MELNGIPSAAELLTQQFYNWEIRGRGWLIWDSPVQLEPPFRPFEGHVLPNAFFRDDGRESSLLSSMADRFLGFLGSPSPPVLDTPDNEEVEPAFKKHTEEIAEIQFSLPRDLQPAPEVFEQCLFSLAYCRNAVSFEH